MANIKIKSVIRRQRSLKSYGKISRVRLLICVMLCISIVTVFIVSVGFTWKQSMIVLSLGNEGPLSLIGKYYIRPLIFFIFLFAIFYFKISRKRKAFSCFMLILAFISAIAMNFPTTTARFYAFAMWFGLLIILYPPNSRNRSFYLFALFFGIIGSYLINFLPGYVLQSRNEFNFFSPSYFYSRNFDAYENFVHSIDYVSENGIVWGKQFFGAILFWVPREWWPGKPIGTGSFIASGYLNASFTNVGFPFIGEAYVNLYIPGILVFSWLIGILFGFLDTKYRAYLYWLSEAKKNKAYSEKYNFEYMILYPIIVGLVLFVMRGDMMSSTAYSCGIIAAYLTVRSLVIQHGKGTW